jgi:hypothetical protein
VARSREDQTKEKNEPPGMGGLEKRRPLLCVMGDGVWDGSPRATPSNQQTKHRDPWDRLFSSSCSHEGVAWGRSTNSPATQRVAGRGRRSESAPAILQILIRAVDSGGAAQANGVGLSVSRPQRPPLQGPVEPVSGARRFFGAGVLVHVPPPGAAHPLEQKGVQESSACAGLVICMLASAAYGRDVRARVRD